MPENRQKTDDIDKARRHGRRITDGQCAALALLLVAPALSAASDTQSLEAIERAAEAHLSAVTGGGRGEPSAVPLDRRLKLARCDQALQPFLRPGSQVRQRTVVGVRCAGSRPWKVYVPVNLVAMAEVLVVTRALPRGHLLEAADIRLERRDVSRLAGGYLSDPAAVLGQRLKQSLRPGSILGNPVLAARTLVRRGQTVTINAVNAAISIRMAGKALMDGALNQRIRVENTASGRVVEGIVRSAERVEILVQ